MIERTVAFGADSGLIGTLCLPDRVAPGGLGQLLFNAGVVHRIGPHRINVRLARDLARAGIPSLRFDFAGLGDSPRRSGPFDFHAEALADLRVAMDVLAHESGATRFALFGFCSGGPHSYAAAQADERIAGVILYDTYIYRTLRSRLNRYLNPVRQKGLVTTAAGWLSRLPGLFTRHEPRPGGAIEFQVPSPEEFVHALQGFQARGVQVSVMYSGGFPELYNYATQFEDVFGASGITRWVDYRYYPDMDHTATLLAAQSRFRADIAAWVVALEGRCRTTRA
jgi:dienelactone hydrolase